MGRFFFKQFAHIENTLHTHTNSVCANIIGANVCKVYGFQNECANQYGKVFIKGFCWIFQLFIFSKSSKLYFFHFITCTYVLRGVYTSSILAQIGRNWCKFVVYGHVSLFAQMVYHNPKYWFLQTKLHIQFEQVIHVKYLRK